METHKDQSPFRESQDTHASVVRSRNSGRLAKRYHNCGASVPLRAFSTKILSRYPYWYRELEQRSTELHDCFATSGSRLLVRDVTRQPGSRSTHSG